MAMAAMAEGAPMEEQAEQDKKVSGDQHLSITDRIRAAVSAREKYIKDHAESLTLVGFRRLLEQDLGMETSALDIHKKQIKQLVDQMMEADDDSPLPEPESHVTETDVPDVETNVSPVSKEATTVTKDPEEQSQPRKETVQGERKRKAESKPKSGKKTRNVVVSDESEKEASEEEAEPSDSSDKRPQKTKAALKETSEEESDSSDKKPSKKKAALRDASEDEAELSDVSDKKPTKKKKAAPKAAAKKVASKASDVKPVQNKVVEQLKQMIKSSGMSIPPSIYKRVKQAPEDQRDNALIKELESILQKEGLNRHSSDKDIKAVKRKKDKQKDLEGIDVTNIITAGRARRHQNNDFFEAPVAAKAKPKPKRRKAVVSDDDDDEGEKAASDKSEVKEEQS